MQGSGDVSWSGAPISATASSPPRRKKNTRTLRVSSKPSQPMSGSSACSTSISGTAGASQDSGANALKFTEALAALLPVWAPLPPGRLVSAAAGRGHRAWR